MKVGVLAILLLLMSACAVAAQSRGSDYTILPNNIGRYYDSEREVLCYVVYGGISCLSKKWPS